MNEDLILTFAADESGDPSFSFEKGASRLFVAAIISTREPDLLRESLRQLKLDQHLPVDYEFKFHHLSSSRLKEKVFLSLAKAEFSCRALIVEKTLLPVEMLGCTPIARYLLFLSELISHIPANERENGTLILDEYGGRIRLSTEIRRTMRARNIRPDFRHCFVRDSKDEPLIQVADLMAGAIAHRDSIDGSDYISMVENKITQVVEYPV